MVSADDSYVMVVLGGLSIVGLMVTFFFSGESTSDGSSGPASATVWGYGLVSISIACLMFMSFALTNKINQRLNNSSGSELAWALLKQASPLFLLLIIVSWIAGLNMTYWERINKGEVPAEYTQFFTLSSIITTLEIILLMKWLNETMAIAHQQPSAQGGSDADIKKRTAEGDQMRYISYLMSLLNFVFAGMMTIVLRYFSTDG